MLLLGIIKMKDFPYKLEGYFIHVYLLALDPDD